MTDEILEMIEKRQLLKDSDKTSYRFTDKKKLKKATAEWCNLTCEDIESLDNKYNNFNLHKKVKEVAEIYETKRSEKQVDKNVRFVLDKTQCMKILN